MSGFVSVVGAAGTVAVVAAARPLVSVPSGGPQGPPGSSGAGFVHSQSTPSAQWTVAHNLGLRPSVELISSGGVEMEAQVTHLSDNTLQVDFTSAQTGTARCT